MTLPRLLLPAPFLLSMALLAGPCRVHATDYYVSSRTGNDAYSGVSTKQPWQSIQRVNHFTFAPGDRILLHAGEAWQEQLRPSSSGTEEQPIVYASYGSGPRPALEGTRGLELAGNRTKPFPTGGNGDVAIDNNDQSHILYDGLELRHILEGLRIYVWSTSVRDVTLQNCFIRVEAEARGGPSSAAVYASVRKGTISRLRILGNHLIPHSQGLEHWGVYFVNGVQHFQISGNTLAPAGEDAITVWHSAYGEISHNQGGGNGENTIDVKDSHDVDIFNNDADLDREYNIVVHSVDAEDSTYNIRVAHNRCSRGGQGGELSAGIALLFVQKSGVEDNLIDFAFGAGILVKDSSGNAGNWVSHNRLTGNGGGRHLPAIVLQSASATQAPSVRVEANQITPP